MKGAFKNMVDWIHSNLHIDLIKYMTDSQVYTSNDVLQVMNDLMKQEVKSGGIQCYNIHHELILFDLFTGNDIYNNDSYVSYADWEIEKTPEANLEKIELDINKPETNLIKIDFNINVNDNEMDNMNNVEAVHSSGDLIDNNNNNIEDYGTQNSTQAD